MPAIPIVFVKMMIRSYPKHQITNGSRIVSGVECDSSVEKDLVSSFVSLRQINPDDGPVPVTLRKLEGLQRLAEAGALMWSWHCR
jgi:DNA replicative helicase MCM subunit Mcm2 (Cdc46/Mcm family)